MTDVATRMQSVIRWRQGVDNPVGQLRLIVDRMDTDLIHYKSKYPEAAASINKRADLINSLDDICRTLEQCEPIDVWRMIWGKLDEAKNIEFTPDIAMVYIPLKVNLPSYAEAKQVVIDLCGYAMDNPRDYDYARGKLYTSSSNERSNE